MKPDLHLASFSDVHLGHIKTPTLHITTNLGRAFPDAPSTHALDMMLCGGDLFDRLLSLDQQDVPQILEWAGSTLQMCERNKIHFVLMEGTPSHDRGQARILDSLRKMGIGQHYFHYITDLSIHHFPDLGLDILFVPDEWRPEPDDTWREVRDLLREKGLDQVDFTVLHGTFDFQLPEQIKTPRHVLERYESITRHYIFGAHIHTPVSKGKLRVNGSFDRLAHNEEEAKGHWRVKFHPNRPSETTFVTNEGAMVYRTIDCSEMELDQALHQLRGFAKMVPPGSHLRIKALKTDAVLSNLDVLRKEYPQLNWTSKAIEAEVVQKNLLVDLREAFTAIQITPDNIIELAMNKIHGMTEDVNTRRRCHEQLQHLVNT